MKVLPAFSLLTLLLTLGATPCEAQARPSAALGRSTWKNDPAIRRAKPLELARTQIVGAQSALSIELFEGRRVITQLEHFEHTRPGGFTWLGKLDTDPMGYVALAIQGRAVVGTVFANGVIYRVRETRGDGLVLYERSAGHRTTCGTNQTSSNAPTEPPAVPHEESVAPPATPRGLVGMPGNPLPKLAHSVVDSLVVWTQEAEDLLGGPAAVQALIDLALLETNMIFSSSEAAIELRLVHSALINYTEAEDMEVDLERLMLKSDGFMDEVHGLRDQYGADVVSLVTAYDGFCGRSFNMTNAPSADFEDNAFTVVSQACATGEYSFGHELGHTFGLDHDRTNTGSTPTHPFAYGFWLANGVFRTVMALPRWGVEGVRIPFYSNPNLIYQNQHFLGVRAPHNQSSDCTLALKLNAPICASWRPTVVQ